jgi:ABC-2 type transport system ATP-binding protein
MKQKILISAALLHNPDVLVFDEPFSGLDVTTSLVFKNLLKALARQGKAILYSSHVLEVVEKVCTSVIILRKGCVVANDSVARLRDLMKLPSLEGIFSQLVLQEDTEKIAEDIVDVIEA